MAVIDTSLVVAYLLNEPAADAIKRLIMAGGLHAPDVLLIESANALVTAARRRRLGTGQVPVRCALVRRLPIALHASDRLIDRAVGIAIAWHRRPYDGVFVALAEMLDTQVLTLDRKLVQGLHGTPLADRVRLLAE